MSTPPDLTPAQFWELAYGTSQLEVSRLTFLCEQLRQQLRMLTHGVPPGPYGLDFEAKQLTALKPPPSETNGVGSQAHD